MKVEVEDDHENREALPQASYLRRMLQATLTIWLSLTMVILAAFGLSESLRVAGVQRDENLLITFLVSLGLILLTLWLLPRSFLTLKEVQRDEVRVIYVQRVLQSLSIIWAILALMLIVTIGFYSVLLVARVGENVDLLITFLVSLGLILLTLWLVPKSFLTF